jgi:hypothetical protein
MQLRRENKFNVKHVRAFIDEMSEAGDLMRAKVEEMNDDLLFERSSTDPDDHGGEHVYEVEVMEELEANRSSCGLANSAGCMGGQTNSARLHGPGTRKRRSRTGPDRL